MLFRHQKDGHYRILDEFWEVTDVSEMPCRLIDGLHEWRNEITAVPN